MVRDADKMAVDGEEEMDEGSEDVSETKITLVNEANLESAIPFRLLRVPYLSLFRHLPASKEQYARIDFIHIYSLSPSPIHVSTIPVPSSASRELPFRNQPSYASPRRVFGTRERALARVLPLH